MKSHFVTYFLFILFLSFVFGQSYLAADEDNQTGSIIELEDEMIIKEIEIDEDKSPDSGTIIYDDEFDDELTEIIKADRSRKTAKKNKTSDFNIQYLQKKDSRWHLTGYTIKKNDNLWKIARHFSISHTLLIKVNNITKPGHLLPGKKLLVPNKNGVMHTVKKNDTILRIAGKYKIGYKRIINHNKIRPRFIQPGQKLFIPDAREIIVQKQHLNKKTIKQKHDIIITSAKHSFTWPVRGKITSRFGVRKDPFSGRKKFHCGIDISTNTGTPVKAAANGRVIYSGWKNGYGKVVIIRHKKGYISVYAHNSKNTVSKGIIIKQGEQIALSGSTGQTTGPHVHFEIRKYITPLNPLRLIK